MSRAAKAALVRDSIEIVIQVNGKVRAKMEVAANADKDSVESAALEQDNVVALEMSANLLLERGEVERAQHCLGRAITVHPESGHTKYLTAGQGRTGVVSSSESQKDCVFMA